MNNAKRTQAALAALLVIIFSLAASGCQSQSETVYKPSDSSTADTIADAVPADSDSYSDFDRQDTWDTSDAVMIALDETNADIDGEGAILEKNTLSITEPGTYVLSGTFTGTIKVFLEKTQKAHLILNGVQIQSADTAAIQILSADKVVLTLAPDTENILSDGDSYAGESGAEPNACIFSKDDLTINGTGALTVYANSNNGIGCKDDLKILDGTITIRASRNAIKGNDSVRIYGGNITVTMCIDGIKSDNETDASKGYVSILGGTVSLKCEDDGIQAVTGITITNALVTVDAADDAVNCDKEVLIAEGCLITES